MASLVFFGSSSFSIIVLEKLLASKPACRQAGAYPITIVTTPDKPAGRHLKLTPNPLKVFALKNNLPVYTSPLSFPSPKLGEGSGGEVLGLVAAYGQILPQSILDKFNGQIYNIHPSLLPKYRGPSPLQQQILDGLIETGVTIIQIDAKMDHGPIVAQEKDIIRPDDTWITLGERLFAKGADLFLTDPLTTRIPQDDNLASYTKKLTRQSGFVSQLNANDSTLNAKFRAYFNWPGVWSLNPEGKRLKLLSLEPWQVAQFP